MKVTTILSNVLVLEVAASNVDAWSCFSTGQSQSPQELYRHTTRACRGYDGNKGAFQGSFKAGEKKTACAKTPAGHVKMELTNNEKHTRDLTDGGCEKEFHALIGDCVSYMFGTPSTKGGKGEVAKWYFRFDPNEGSC